MATLKDQFAPRQNVQLEPRSIVPTRCEELDEAARIADPRKRGVWRGSHDARLAEQGITIQGAPVGRPEFVVSALFRIAERQGELLQKIPEVKDLQCAWLIFSTAASRGQRSTPGQCVWS